MTRRIQTKPPVLFVALLKVKRIGVRSDAFIGAEAVKAVASNA